MFSFTDIWCTEPWNWKFYTSQLEGKDKIITDCVSKLIVWFTSILFLLIYSENINYFGTKINFIDLKHSRQLVQHKCNYILHINLPLAPVLSHKNTITFISLYIRCITSYHLDKNFTWIRESDPLIMYNERNSKVKPTCEGGLGISLHSLEFKNADSSL